MVQLIPLPPHHLVSLKSTLVYPFRWRLVQVVLKKRTLNGCLSVCHPLYVNGHFQVKLQFSSSTCSETESFGSWQQVFYRPKCPFCHPTNSLRALKEISVHITDPNQWPDLIISLTTLVIRRQV